MTSTGELQRKTDTTPRPGDSGAPPLPQKEFSGPTGSGLRRRATSGVRHASEFDIDATPIFRFLRFSPLPRGPRARFRRRPPDGARGAQLACAVRA